MGAPGGHRAYSSFIMALLFGANIVAARAYWWGIGLDLLQGFIGLILMFVLLLFINTEPYYKRLDELYNEENVASRHFGILLVICYIVFSFWTLFASGKWASCGRPG